MEKQDPCIRRSLALSAVSDFVSASGLFQLAGNASRETSLRSRAHTRSLFCARQLLHDRKFILSLSRAFDFCVFHKSPASIFHPVGLFHFAVRERDEEGGMRRLCRALLGRGVKRRDRLQRESFG